jgi:uncharacterized protein (DUF305 family)
VAPGAVPEVAGTLTVVSLDTGAPPSPPEQPGDVADADQDEAPQEHAPWRSTPVLIGLVVVFTALVAIGGVLVWQRSTTPGAGSVDVGFMQDMTSHHNQAVQMASIAAEQASDPDIRAFAREILIAQRYEIGYMEALLEDWGQYPYSEDCTAMQWMDMGSPVGQMPGMQPDAEIRQLQNETGATFDQHFLRMMLDHHLGGIHMAEYAATHAEDPRVRSLAERMATQQQGDIGDFRRAAQRLGYDLG